MITKEIKDRCGKILNCFETGSQETDYRHVYIYGDGNGGRRQLTLGRGFTSDGGNLWRVLQRYIDKDGTNADFFRGYKGKMPSSTIYKDRDLINMIIKSAKEDQSMRDAQDEIFDEVYWTPAYNYFDNGEFQENLSMCVIFDSFLHSGRMTPRLVNSFAEKKPSGGGSEHIWIKSYLEARLSWFSNSNGLLRNTVYRPKLFLGEIKKGKWDLSLPLYANGIKIT